MGSTAVGGSDNSFSACFDLRTLLHYLPRTELKIRRVADYFWRTSRKSQYRYRTGSSLQLRLMCWVFPNANDINCNLFSMKLPHMSFQVGSSPIPRVLVLPINRSLQFHPFMETFRLVCVLKVRDLNYSCSLLFHYQLLFFRFSKLSVWVFLRLKKC